MKPEDINRIIALSQGWKWRYSRPKRELRWFGPDGHNWLQPPDYYNDSDQMAEVLSWLNNEDYRRVLLLDDDNNPAVAYVKFLSEKP